MNHGPVMLVVGVLAVSLGVWGVSTLAQPADLHLELIQVRAEGLSPEARIRARYTLSRVVGDPAWRNANRALEELRSQPSEEARAVAAEELGRVQQHLRDGGSNVSARELLEAFWLLEGSTEPPSGEPTPRGTASSGAPPTPPSVDRLPSTCPSAQPAILRSTPGGGAGLFAAFNYAAGREAEVTVSLDRPLNARVETVGAEPREVERRSYANLSEAHAMVACDARNPQGQVRLLRSNTGQPFTFALPMRWTEMNCAVNPRGRFRDTASGEERQERLEPSARLVASFVCP